MGSFPRPTLASGILKQSCAHLVVFMFGKPVIVVIEDGWHGNLKMGFFQGHKWEETGVEKNVEFDKPAKKLQLYRMRCSRKELNLGMEKRRPTEGIAL